MNRIVVVVLSLLFSIVAVSAALTTSNEAYWSLNSTNADATGNSNTLTISSASYNSSGKIAEGLTFAGSSSSNADTGITLPSTDFSIAGWVYIEDLPAFNSAGIFSSVTTTTNRDGIQLGVSDNGWRMVMYKSNSALAVIDSRNDASLEYPQLDTWYHYVVTYDESESNVTMYLNGSYYYSDSVSGTFTVQDDTLHFGTAYISETAYAGNHTHDELSYWTRVISESEASDLHNGGVGYNPYAVSTNTTDVELTVVDAYDGSSITEFNASVAIGNDVYDFSTTNGTIVTNISSNTTYLLTINFTAEDYWSNTSSDVNVSSGSYEGSMAQAFVRFDCYERYTEDSLSCDEEGPFPRKAGTYTDQINVSGYLSVNVTYNISAKDEGITGYPSGYVCAGCTLDGELDVGVQGFYNRDVTVLAKNRYDNSSVSEFNVSLTDPTDSYTTTNSTTNGSLILRVLGNSSRSYTVRVNASDYFGFNESTTLNSTYEPRIYQSIAYVQVLDVVSESYVPEFNMSDSNYTYDTSGTLITFYPKPGNYTLSLGREGYNASEESLEVLALSTNNITFNATPTIFFQILRERDLEPFEVNETNATTLTIVCSDTRTLEYQFNVSANDHTLEQPVDCVYEFMKVDFIYGTDSYYRTYIPDYNGTRNITFYAVDIEEDLVVQVILNLNDLTGDYGDGTVTIQKTILEENYQIIKSYWDVEEKSTLYLIKDALYTLQLTDNDGVQRNLGYLIAEAAGEKTVTVPQLSFEPDLILGDEVSWSWAGSNQSQVKLVYSDLGGDTTGLTFTVYNGTNTSQTLYTASGNGTTVTFTYTHSGIPTYACFNATHATLGKISECRSQYGTEGLGSFTEFDSDQQSKLFRWGSIFLIVFVVLASTPLSVSLGLGAAFILAIILRVLGWFSFNDPVVDSAVLSILGLIAVFSFFLEGERR